MKEAVREMMSRAEEAWKEYHAIRNVSAWELSERLEAEKTTEARLGDGLLYLDVGFDPVFKVSSVKASWWEHPASWCIAKLEYDGRAWDIHVSSQGKESECERICFELAEEESNEKD